MLIVIAFQRGMVHILCIKNIVTCFFRLSVSSSSSSDEEQIIGRVSETDEDYIDWGSGNKSLKNDVLLEMHIMHDCLHT